MKQSKLHTVFVYSGFWAPLLAVAILIAGYTWHIETVSWIAFIGLLLAVGYVILWSPSARDMAGLRKERRHGNQSRKRSEQ